MGPAIGVEPSALGDSAGILQVAEADVVRRQRHPGAVRFGDPLGNLPDDALQVARTAPYALLGILAIVNAHRLGGAQGQHHHAADAGRGHGPRVPVRLLVADRREQPPVHAVLGGRVLEPGAVARQAGIDVLQEGARADVVEAVGMTEIAVGDLRQPPVGLDLAEVAVRGLDQAAVVAGAKRPRDRLGLAEIESHADVGIKELVDQHRGGVGHRQLDLAARHPRQ